METSFQDLLQFMYQAPVGLCQADLDGTIEFITPMGVQLLMPLCHGNELDNIFDVMGKAAPEVRNAVIGFDKKRGKILTEHRCPVIDNTGTTQAVLGVTIVKLSPKQLAISISDVTALVEKENEAAFGQKMLTSIGQILEGYRNIADDPGTDGACAGAPPRPDAAPETADGDAQPFKVLVVDDSQNLVLTSYSSEIVASADACGLDQSVLSKLLLAATQKGFAKQETLTRRKDGQLYWAEIMATRLRSREGKPAGYSIVVRETSKEKAREYALAEMASKDPLTGALNRRAFFNLVRLAVAELQHERTPYAIILVDLDHFKTLNDTFGHAAGDAVLKAFVEHSNRNLQDKDYLGRFGGEEFLFFLRNISLAEAVEKAEALRKSLSDLCVDWDGRQIKVTASMGVAVPQGGDPADFSAVIELADAALYRAKAGGRNRVLAADSLLPPTAAAE